jgi:hypothetical protein
VIQAVNTCSACAVETRGLVEEACDAPGLEKRSVLIGLSRNSLFAVGLVEFILRRPAGLLCNGESNAAERLAFFVVLVAAGLSIAASLDLLPIVRRPLLATDVLAGLTGDACFQIKLRSLVGYL